MPSDYEQITEDNIVEYGKGTRHLDLLSTRYTNRTHFVFEILQNAEDAGASRILFKLFRDKLEVMHNGRPFNEEDVRGICGVGEGTKAEDLTKIGKFGIGFKSVYVYTTAPEVHSGDENFRIEHYVRPHAVTPKKIPTPWTTLFLLPFDQDGITAEIACKEIGYRLRDLSTRTILFLRNIETIEYQLPGLNGRYNRRQITSQDTMRQVIVKSEDSRDENWIVFERLVPTPDKNKKVPVEIAYKLEANPTDGPAQITGINESPLSVYFPTERDTRLGFLIQGPYRTTLARDNIPSDDKWNQKLINETAELVVTSLQQLKDMDLLTVPLLESLPIRSRDFPENSLFFPIFARVCEALKNADLLPTIDDSFISAQYAVLARSDAVRNILTHAQLGQLFGSTGDQFRWLSAEITLDRTPELRGYIMESLEIEEVTPDMFARRLSREFLRTQTDEWFIKFYKFLSGQPALWRSKASILRTKPILRLQDETHIIPSHEDFPPTAYLSVATRTDASLPIIKWKISQDKDAYNFLKTLGIQESDIVAEVIETLLPKYKQESPTISINDHLRDFTKIERAYSTDSREKKERLLKALRETPFILAANSRSEYLFYLKPEQLYFRTDALRMYFEWNDLERWIEIWEDQNDNLAYLRKCFRSDISGGPTGAFVNLDVYPNSAKALFTDLGISDAVKIQRKKADSQGYVPIVSKHGRHERGLEEFDPHIQVDGLNHALNNPTPEKSAFIWNHIAIPNADCIKGVVEQSNRKDYSNSSQEEIISRFFGRLLIDTKWLPDSDGNMHRPSEITLDALPDSIKKDEPLARKLGMPISKARIIDIVAPEIGVSSDILNRIIDAPPEIIEQIESLLQYTPESTFIAPTTPQDAFFPANPVSNPERREKHILSELKNAPDKEYVEKVRSVRTTRDIIDPKTWLREQYTNDDNQMVCQMCQEEMPFKYGVGTYYFEAVEMLKGHFTKEYEAQFLALCPECSPKYKAFIKQVPEAMDTLRQQLIDSDQLGDFEIPLKLGDSDTSLRFVERHWLDMKTILGFYAQQPEPSDETVVPSEEQPEPQVKKSQQSKEEGSNWDADRLLNQFFTHPIRFITYAGVKDLSEIKMKPYTLWGIDAKGEEVKIAKLDILFAFPKEKMPALKPYVKVRKLLKGQNLQPIENQNERFHVDDELLTQAKEHKSQIEVVTRSGHVLNGWIQHFDKFVLYMRVGEKVVIVYRHGLYGFAIEGQ